MQEPIGEAPGGKLEGIYQPENVEDEDKARRKHARFQRKKATYYRDAFKSEAGEFILAELAAMCHMFNPMFEPGMTGMELAHLEGERKVVTYLMRHARITDDDIVKIQRVKI